MYTVLWTKPNIGYEEILPSAKRVWFREGHDTSDQTIFGIEYDNGDIIIYDEGNFYVMNASGKTVGTYRLKSAVLRDTPETKPPMVEH